MSREKRTRVASKGGKASAKARAKGPCNELIESADQKV
jgi:hypothetical protein